MSRRKELNCTTETGSTCLTFFLLAIAAGAAVTFIPLNRAIDQTKEFCEDNSRLCNDLYEPGIGKFPGGFTADFTPDLEENAIGSFILTALCPAILFTGILSITHPQSLPHQTLIKSSGSLLFLAISTGMQFLNSVWISSTCTGNDRPDDAPCAGNFPKANYAERHQMETFLDELSKNYFIASAISIAACLLPLCLMTNLTYPAIKRIGPALRACGLRMSGRNEGALLATTQRSYNGKGADGSATNANATL